MRIVLVDPSRTVLRCVTRLLESGNHEVRPFVDGREALDYIKTDPDVSALITSAGVNSMTGLELCWETRLLAAHQRPIYILVMSSNYDRNVLIEALDCGADDFISKPPITEELYARLRAAERIISMQRNLVRLATTDSLTGMLSRRAFFERATEACARAEAGELLSAIMIDIDHFKRVNDQFGHGIGDEALCEVARVAAAESDIAGRLGGEEFAILLEGMDLAQAGQLAERLRLKFERLRVLADDVPLTLTCSLGISEWRRGDQIDELLRRADMALYQAKNSGRNRVVAADAPLVPTNDVGSCGISRSPTRSMEADVKDRLMDQTGLDRCLAQG